VPRRTKDIDPADPSVGDIHLTIPEGESIRSLALDQACAALRGLGCSEEEIVEARAEAERTNSDQPLINLAIPKFAAMAPPLRKM
jgi:hypothetical protein